MQSRHRLLVILTETATASVTKQAQTLVEMIKSEDRIVASSIDDACNKLRQQRFLGVIVVLGDRYDGEAIRCVINATEGYSTLFLASLFPHDVFKCEGPSLHDFNLPDSLVFIECPEIDLSAQGWEHELASYWSDHLRKLRSYRSKSL